jgi:hypothetical protein
MAYETSNLEYSIVSITAQPALAGSFAFIVIFLISLVMGAGAVKATWIAAIFGIGLAIIDWLFVGMVSRSIP